MRRCKMLVVYRATGYDRYDLPLGFQMLYASLITKRGEITCLLSNNGTDTYIYKSFNEMIASCLSFAKIEGYTINKYIDFNALWYDIRFVNAEDGSYNRYPYKVLESR